MAALLGVVGRDLPLAVRHFPVFESVTAVRVAAKAGTRPVRGGIRQWRAN